MFQDGSPLTRHRLVSVIRATFESAGVNPALLSSVTGHSFRIGAAIVVARACLEDSMIQTLGRWQSSAYHWYICMPAESLAASSA